MEELVPLVYRHLLAERVDARGLQVVLRLLVRLLVDELAELPPLLAYLGQLRRVRVRLVLVEAVNLPEDVLVLRERVDLLRPLGLPRVE